MCFLKFALAEAIEKNEKVEKEKGGAGKGINRENK